MSARKAATHADPHTTMRYDRARVSLDRHATYTRVHESADRIYRLSTFVPDIGPTCFTFNIPSGQRRDRSS
ncbi:MAG: hypothetical protein NVSMB12_15010 [Acidimicrobiales bacterium]